ncbi:5-methyltetrahydropteroyltriglutamate--homocysteine methyltransferase [Halarchaeum salinum]|uniref:Cobalamin-independent methionine synthase MetE N-terminal domain-containing protein n=1 Tax=Halarchaeum salinum TaxID=489912 RepID=A0AAV3S4T9_9EURY
MEQSATTVGLFPLPDGQRERLAELKGHQKSDLIDGDEKPAVREAYSATRNHYIDRQRDAGLDRIVEGQGRWDDLLAHPLCIHENVRTGGIVRYYDNNNFYREPIVTGELTPSGDVPAELAAASERCDDLQAVLPGPYSLAGLASDEHYGSFAALLDGVAGFLAGEVAAFPDAVETLTLLEPGLATDPPDAAAHERISEAIDTIAAASDAEVIVHTYWGMAGEDLYRHLLDTGADGLGYDLVAAPDAAGDLVAEYGAPPRVLLGVVDGQNTLIEGRETIRERVRRFEERAATDVKAAYLTPNTGLFHLPVSKFEAKLDALAAAAGGAQ